MISDRQRKILNSDVRQILKRVASMGSRGRPDEAELATLDLDDASIDRVRAEADRIAELSDSGGLRSRHTAAREAEEATEAILIEAPRQYAGSVPAEVGDDGPSASDLAEAVIARRDSHPSHAEDVADRERLAEARRLLRG